MTLSGVGRGPCNFGDDLPPVEKSGGSMMVYAEDRVWICGGGGGCVGGGRGGGGR